MSVLEFLTGGVLVKNRAGSSAQLPTSSELRQRANKAGLIVTEELDGAITRCKKKVEKLAAECRKGNRKFRDIEFDLLEDKNRCLHGLGNQKKYTPTDTRRVTQIFEKPEFFVDGATASDIGQGMSGDCWFLSALAVIATAGLVEKMCVARDEQVGIYGFIFWRDSGWVDVIIDDLLFTKSPKWESLSPREQMLYHQDRDRYNRLSRKGSKTLYFARSQTENETWVPLVEKAYAKLHGDYASLEGGLTNEAVEDLTGGVSTLLYVQDILDTDAFWRDELMHANEDRLFACFIPEPSGSESEFGALPIIILSTNGLITGHAYSIIKATEFRGKRFVRVRNPWGKAEWTGRWSDGSKEWTKEWLDALEVLEYRFDNDGEFIMEYCDFLDTWEIVEKSLLFGEDWVLSSQWLRVNAGDFPKPWNYGDVSYTIKLDKATRAVVVLAQLDTRYFEELASPFRWSLDFTIYRRDDDEAIVSSIHSSLWERSVNVEVDLDEGEYIVQVRLDRTLRRSKTYVQENVTNWNDRKFSRKQVEYALSSSIAANFDPSDELALPIPLSQFTGKPLAVIEAEAQASISAHRQHAKHAFKRITTEPIVNLGESGYRAASGLGIVAEDSATPIGSSARAQDPSTAINEHPRQEGNSGVPELIIPEHEELQPEVSDGEESIQDVETHDPKGKGVDWNPVDDDGPSTGPSTPIFVSAQTTFLSPQMAQMQMGLRTEGMQFGAMSSMGIGQYMTPRIGEVPKTAHELCCNGCKASIIGPLFHCVTVTCPDYDLCQTCHDLGVHPKDHVFLKLEHPEDSLRIQDRSRDTPTTNSVVLGLRVYTNKDSPAVITGHLRHGEIIRQSVLLSKVL